MNSNSLIFARRAWVLMFLLGLVAIGINGQSTRLQSKILFPKDSSEFTVVFPKPPEIEKVFASGASGISAELILDDCFIRAEVIEMTEEQSKNVAQHPDSRLSDIALAYAKANGFSAPSVSVGTNKNGRYAKLRGYKEIEKKAATFEVIFVYGKRQAITLFGGGLSADYPQSGISNFFDSLATIK